MQNARDYRLDVQRIAETIYTVSRGKIVDRDTFDDYWQDYMGDTTHQQDSILKPKVFDEITDNHPNVSKEKIFTKAKGKNLRRDKRQTASTVVEDKEEYKQTGADKVDLKNLDTAEKYDDIGIVKGQVVKVRKDTFSYKGKTRTVYRDRKGRFASKKV